MELHLPQHRLCLVSFEELFRNNIEIKLINDLDKYKLLSGILTKETKLFFFHHIIYEICQYILHKKTNDKIVIYFANHFENLELSKYLPEKDIQETIQKVVISMKKYLPIQITESLYPFEYFIHLYGKEDGRAIEIISNIKQKCNNFNPRKYTFSRIKEFSKTHNLTFLNKQFFNDIKTGQLLFA